MRDKSKNKMMTPATPPVLDPHDPGDIETTEDESPKRRGVLTKVKRALTKARAD